MSIWTRRTPPFLHLKDEDLFEYNRMTSPGSPRGQCIQCGRYFNSDSAFDMHQRVVPEVESGTVCLNPEDLGMAQLNSGHWVTSRWEDDYDNPWDSKPNPWL